MLLQRFSILVYATTTLGCLFAVRNTCSPPGVSQLARGGHDRFLHTPCCQSEPEVDCDYLSVLMRSDSDGLPLRTKLGDGSMGTVYKIQHPDSGETFALKTFQPGPGEKPSHFASAVQGEFGVASRVKSLPGFIKSHALITSIRHDTHGDHSPECHLVMEYVPWSLKAIITTATRKDNHDRQWTDADIRCLFTQALHGVRLLHTNVSLAHRDIKPGNLLMTLDGHLRLIDFGEAVSTSQGRRAHTFTGTPPYLAPELYTVCHEGYDAAAADLWGLGMLLLRMYLDDDPWDASDAQQDVDFATFRNDPEAYLQRLDFAPDVHQALITLLSLDPQTRYQIDSVWQDAAAAVVGPKCIDDGHGQLRLVIDYE